MSGSEGRYDAESRAVLELTRAIACVVIVLDGRQGSGFSVSVDTRSASPPSVIAGLPALLRKVASSIESERN